MELQKRNPDLKFPALGSQAGQTVVEYILTLVVTVGLVLGGIYQLNMAFKVWANNYFGDYLACLLETGELPSVGGTPGADGGVCNTFFKPFSLADGRPLLPPGKGEASSGSKSNYTPGAGSHDHGVGGSNAGGGSGSAGYPAFSQNGSNGKFGANSGKANGSTNTGSTRVSSNSGYSETNRKLDTRTKEQVDQRFAFENDKGSQESRKTASTGRTGAQEGGGAAKIRMRHHEIAKDQQLADDTPMTFGNFMKYLIIAAIVIALVFFIGSQMLQISKSMD